MLLTYKISHIEKYVNTQKQLCDYFNTGFIHINYTYTACKLCKSVIVIFRPSGSGMFVHSVQLMWPVTVSELHCNSWREENVTL